MRSLVLWCPDWPVTAAAMVAGIPAHRPAAVFADNRVLACSAVARRNGVRRGMLRREAQSRCPDVAVLAEDGARDARLFEPVAAAVEDLVAGVDIVRPGMVAAPARGAAAYLGNLGSRIDPQPTAEHRLSEQLTDHVSVTVSVESWVGIADGLFTAMLAARRSTLVPADQDAEFLAPLPISELDQPGENRPELVELLRRLGVHTLGRFAGLPERSVATRFGHAGVLAHRLARGHAQRPLAPRRPVRELAVVQDCDPPLERIDTAAFLARTLAERLHATLTAQDLACTRLGIYARTENGEEFTRVWRSAQPVSAQGIAERVRWQCEGWLRDSCHKPSSGIVHLRLEPEEVVYGTALQLGLWQGDSADSAGHERAEERANRALLRVQGLLGPDGACTPVLGGGRGPADRVRLVPWGDSPDPSEDQAPWPGRLPAPSPATVFAEHAPAAVLDAYRESVALTSRHTLTSPPRYLTVNNGVEEQVLGWSGPWPVDERWWDGSAEGMRARIQVIVHDTGPAFLLLFREHRKPRWIVEGVYD